MADKKMEMGAKTIFPQDRKVEPRGNIVETFATHQPRESSQKGTPKEKMGARLRGLFERKVSKQL